MLERPPPARLSMPTLRKRKARRATVQLATRKWADRGVLCSVVPVTYPRSMARIRCPGVGLASLL
jgi:hypothetical protein